MGYKKNFVIILSFILVLTFCIQVSRLDQFLEIKGNTQLFQESAEKESPLVEQGEEEILIVYNEEKTYLKKIKENIEVTLDYMKLPYRSISIHDPGDSTQRPQNIILVVEEITDDDSFNKILGSIYTGSNVFFPYRLEFSSSFKSAMPQMGILEIDDFIDTKGIHLKDDLLLGGEGLVMKEGNFLTNSSMIMQLSEDVDIQATTSGEVPLLWSKSYGEGEMYYFNGTMLGEKINRGLIASIVRQMGDQVIYPIINAKINYIDDFPSPTPEGFNERIFEEYNRDVESFYKEVWWPEMLRIAKINGVKYTGMAIGTYDDEVEDLNESPIFLSDHDMRKYSRELLLNKGELGIHGYNHQPLTTEVLADQSLGYTPWPSFDKMVEGIQNITGYFKEKMPHYALRTYVPPSNIITEEGIKALLVANPDFRILASLYTVGENEDGYEQELMIDESGIIHLPRLVAGYHYTDEMKWNILMGINLHGYFSHFIHPDDVLDPYRAKDKGWMEMSREYSQMQQDVTQQYPWLKGATATEGANQLINYTEAQLIYTKDAERLVIENANFIDEMTFILQSKQEIKRVINGSVMKRGENLYLITATAARCEILY